MATYAFLVILCVILGNHAVNCVEFGGNCSDSAACNDTLKCENNQCVCDDGYYQVNQSDLTCTKKGKIEESCNGNHTCHESALCVQDETTNCSVSQFPSDSYQLNETTCAPKGKIEDSCNGNHTCHENLVCFQDETTNNSVCQCPSDSYKLNDTACTLKGKIEDSCNGNHTCHENLVCFQDETTNSSVCQCPSGFYKLNDTACAPKGKIEDSCNGNHTCHENLVCFQDETTNNSVCQCPSDSYKLNDTACTLKGKIEDSCNGNHTCHENLVCFQDETTNSSVCQCPSDSYKLNDTACAAKGKIGQDCNGNATCHESVVCVQNETTNSSVCQCPSDSYKLSDTTCAPKRKIGESCNGNETCHEGFECRDDTNNGSVCQCPSDYYEQSGTCAPKIKIGQNCGSNDTCYDDAECVIGVCQCPSGSYQLNDTACAPKIKIGQNCGSNDTCYDDAECVIGVCQCPSGSYQLNDTACAPKRKIGESCNVNETCHEDFECRDDTNNGSVCQCRSDYYEQNGTTCAPKIKIGDSCTINDTCYDDAQCVIDVNDVSGVCQCPSGFYKLNDTACAPKINHGEECAGVTNECGANGTSCRKETGMTKRCLCEAQEFWSTDSKSCQDISNLQVDITNLTSTLSEVTLFWSQPNEGSSLALTYKVTSTDASDSVNTTSATLKGLKSGITYRFNVTTVLLEDEFYNERTTTVMSGEIKTKIDHSGGCSVQGDVCGATGTTCQKDKNGEERCLCAADNFWNATSSSCENISNLQVNITGLTSTLSEVTLFWSQPNEYSSLALAYKVTPSTDASDSVTTTSATLKGLKSGTTYKFNVTTVLQGDNFYNERTTTVVSEEIKTKIDHLGGCSVQGDCGATGTTCENDKNRDERCLCAADNFWNAMASSCENKNNLKVSNLNWTSKVNSANLSWTQPLQTLNLSLTYIVSGGGSPDARIPTGVLVRNLIAGTAYNFSVQTVLAANKYYDNMTTDAAQVQNVWTKPAKPEGNGKEVKIDGNVYNFTFAGSSGGVKEYLVTIKGVLDSNKTTTTWISDVPLTPAQVYKYTIVAVNGIDEKSDSFTGNFLVGAEKPGTVSALQGINQTDTSVTLQWSIPTEPNGNLTGYLVTYYMSIPNEKCLEINISCSDCQDLWPTSVQGSGCSKSASEGYELSEKELNSNQNISLKIKSLQPYRSYRITVQAVNKAGFGEGESIFIRTDIGVAEEIQDLSLRKTGDTMTAGLHISWTAGAETGPTNYTVKVQRKAAIKSENYEFVSNDIVEGYNNTNFDKNDLLAFWDYKVSVTAVTRKGSSESKTEEVKTRPNIPGTVTNFRVVLDPDDAQKFTLSFNCPDETQRNGRLKEYVVQKKHEDKTEEDTINHSDSCSFSIGNFKSNLKVGQNYTFRVKVINDNYTGDFNLGKTHMISPKGKES
ncbi:hypothetical protein RRG08_006035 [Elysia crispata]|uniref:Uncharacterized protein n=1 Tax=Elysia crispata TaxID=231223 RepID=A0AAE1AID6_9GAST|nr:hypothetical protein RRG08_006035 [Elysia crispata]